MQTLASKLSYVHFLFIFSSSSLPSPRQFFFSVFSPFSLLVFCCSVQVFALLLFPFNLLGACVLVMHFIYSCSLACSLCSFHLFSFSFPLLPPDSLPSFSLFLYFLLIWQPCPNNMRIRSPRSLPLFLISPPSQASPSRSFHISTPARHSRHTSDTLKHVTHFAFHFFAR